MRKSRYTETQIITILKAVEAGRTVKDVCREYGISDATYYNWKSKYSGMEASDIKRMKDMDAELSQLGPAGAFERKPTVLNPATTS